MKRKLSSAFLGCIVASSSPLLAAEMDLAPERLSISNGTSSELLTNEAAFRNLISELGFAVASPMLRPASTTGYSGFAVTADLSVTSINRSHSVSDGTNTNSGNVAYWQKGTEGESGSTAQTNLNPSSTLQIYAIRLRKGLPLGLEIGSTLGYMSSTSTTIMGADLHWAILEGFRHGPLSVIPDLSIGSSIRTLVGAPKIYLTTLGLGVRLSKSFALFDVSRLIPFLAYERLIMFGNSTVLDLTPSTNAVPSSFPSETGTVVPRSGDARNIKSFDPVTIHRHRLILGSTYQYEFLYSGAQVAFDLIPPKSENSGIVGPSQWTISIHAGTHF